MPKISMLQAVRDAQYEELKRDPRVFLMGEDIQSNLYGASVALVEEFGADRIRNTPISENGFVGAAAGAAMVGMRPVVDVTIASFLYPAMDQLISNVAKSSYLYGGQTNLPLVIRVIMFYGGNNAAQHSDRPYPMFMGVPGLKIIAPSNPYDMKGLLKSAIRDDNPVLCFEDVTLWGMKAEVPDEDFLVPIGKAVVRRPGNDVTVVAVSGAVVHSLAAAEELANENISVEVIDLRSLAPLDRETVLESVKKTGRTVAVDIAHRTCSAASEIAATVAEEGFWDLKAPIERVTTPDTHMPFSPALEKGLYPTKERIISAIRRTLS
jgi:pyruvate dehydrogenase E1 component beta subunit